MPSDEIVRIDRELFENLRRAGTVAERERLVLHALEQKERVVAAELARENVIPIRLSPRGQS